jgi:molecular chaperone DnaJ
MTPTKDFYAVLGVSPTAAQDEIKKKYRRLAKTHHPDSNPGDAKAAERFKEISEAYGVVGDATKRKQYDEMRALGAYGGFPPGAGGRARPRRSGGAGGGPFAGASSGRFEDFDAGGIGGLGDLFGSIFGAGRGGRQRGPRRACAQPLATS